MKFYQLRIMDFLVREVSLEYEATLVEKDYSRVSSVQSFDLAAPTLNTKPNDAAETTTVNTTASSVPMLSLAVPKIKALTNQPGK